MGNYIQFGSGILYVNPNAGNLATNPTPTRGLTIQDIAIDQKGEIKELRGSSQYPDDTAKGDVKGTFKFGIGRKDFLMLNQIFYGDVQAAGGTSVAVDVSGSIPATSTYTVTPTVPGSGTFSVDLGVRYAATGIEFIKVASGPTVGQYAVSAGVYTFAAADEGVAVLFGFAYTLTATGATYQVNNQAMGYGPQFEAYIVDQYQPKSGVYSTVRLYACKITGVSMTNKRDDYDKPELDGTFFAAASGRVIDWYSNVG
jgi:hypothetical protein